MSLPLEGWSYGGGRVARPDGTIHIEFDEELNCEAASDVSALGSQTAEPTLVDAVLTVSKQDGTRQYTIKGAETSAEIVQLAEQTRAVLSAVTGRNVTLVQTVAFMKLMRKFYRLMGVGA